MLESRIEHDAALDTAVSGALLRRVAEGRAPETLRLHATDEILAFSVLDRTRAGFPRAVEAARAAGFEPIVRLAGGRAALFHGATLAFAWSRPLPEPRAGIHERFREMAEILRGALRSLGADAEIGQLPGEYCPGDYSIHAGGRVKLAGIGQRVIRGAAHLGGVIVAGKASRMREGLGPVYEALDYPLDPATVGSLEDEIGGISLEKVAGALRDELTGRFELQPGEIEPGDLALARELAPGHALC